MSFIYFLNSCTCTDHNVLCMSHLKLIELISATDADDPVDGHHFYFSMIPDKHINPNFTIRDNQGLSQH